MHRETEAVLDRELASKQEVLDQAHATLAALHDRFTALTQVAPPPRRTPKPHRAQCVAIHSTLRNMIRRQNRQTKMRITCFSWIPYVQML